MTDDQTTFKVVPGRASIDFGSDLEERSAPEQHTDHGFTEAIADAYTALNWFQSSLSWARSIGVEVPKKQRDTETILKQWITYLEDERKRRG